MSISRKIHYGSHLPRFIAVFAMMVCLVPLAASSAIAREKAAKPAVNPLFAEIDSRSDAVAAKVITWRRDIHEHPELSNREVRTGKMVADLLTSLGLEVQTGVAHTGVVGVLKGGKPGPCVALRADMDALPVTEETGLPFASKVTAEYNGEQVGVMHACGHDVHTSVLMGVAEVLAGMRKDIPGTVKFIFQPAEEGAPSGEDGGAGMMINEGALENPKPDAIFGLHVFPDAEAGTIAYRPGGTMAAVDGLHITVKGVQTHGAEPWGGVDPIVTSAQIIMGLQTIVSRQEDIRKAPAVVTIGIIKGGVRSNIIPDTVEMTGTIRTLDPEMRKEIHAKIKRTVENIAASAGATADVTIGSGDPVTYNDPDLTARMLPTLERVAGKDNVILAPPKTGGEDFSLFAKKVPGLFINLGCRARGADLAATARNHSPKFMVDESAIPLGIKTMANLAVEYLVNSPKSKAQSPK